MRNLYVSMVFSEEKKITTDPLFCTLKHFKDYLFGFLERIDHGYSVFCWCLVSFLAIGNHLSLSLHTHEMENWFNHGVVPTGKDLGFSP